MDIVLAAQVQLSEAEDVTKAVLLEIVHQMSIDISYVRKIKVKQEKRLRFFMDEAGPNWRESRFVFAISALQTAVYQEDAYLKRALDNIHCMVLITQQKQSEKGQLWWALKPEEAMPDEYASQLEYTHQRTDKWFEARKSRPLTGSTLYAGCGMGKFKDLVRHYDTKILDVADMEEVSEDTAKFMRHGTINEENAIATLVGIVMPLYYPDYSYYEEGAHLIEGSDGEPLMLVSPDGSLRPVSDGDTIIPTARVVVEVKCPYPNEFVPPVHYKVPERYVPQVLSEMAAMHVDECIYLSWSKHCSTVFRIKFDEMLWAEIKDEGERLYGNITETDKRKRRPKTLNAPFRKKIQELMLSFMETKIEMLAELPSLYKADAHYVAPPSPVPLVESTPYYSLPQPDNGESDLDMSSILFDSEVITTEAYELTRRKATEVVVWLMSDIDRLWHAEIPHSIPVAWAMKGNSLLVRTMRDMTEDILQTCHEEGISIACVCFDGAFAPMAFLAHNGTPLTVLQLCRTIWEEVKEMFRKKTRALLLKEIGSIDVKPFCTYQGHHGIDVRSPGACIEKAMTSYRRLVTEQIIPDTMDGLSEDPSEADADLAHLPTEALDVVQELTSDPVNESEAVVPEVSSVRECTLEEQSDVNELIGGFGIAERVPQPRRSGPPVDLDKLLEALQKDKQGKWANTSVQHLEEKLSSAEKMKNMIMKDLKVVIAHTEPQQRHARLQVRKSWDKTTMVNALAKIIGDGTRISR